MGSGGTAPAARLVPSAERQRALEARAARAVSDYGAYCGMDEARHREGLEGRLCGLSDAMMASPFWRERLAAAALSPYDLRSLDDLGPFPALTREAYGAHFEALAATTEGDDLVVVQSSGTTGTPVRVLRDRWGCVEMWAVVRFWSAHLGIELGDRPSVVLLCALPGGLEYEASLPLLLDGRLRRISTVTPEPARRLTAADPVLLSTDPAGLSWLRAHPDVVLAPRLITSGAQRLPFEWRTDFNAPIVNYYAATEVGPVAWECLRTAGRFHVLSPRVFVESGPDRSLRVTRLDAGPVPLLRYEPGDYGQVGWRDCDCGVRGYCIEGLEARERIRFIRPDGSDVDAWQLAWVFKHHPLSAFRLTQRGLSQFELQLVGDGRGLAARLIGVLKTLGWPAPELGVTRVAALGGGKPSPFRVDRVAW